jgi:phosphocarrier protein
MPEVVMSVRSEEGLHARPSAELVKEACRWQCVTEVCANGRTADAKSILQVLALGAKSGDRLLIRTCGEREEEAMQSLVAVVERCVGAER